MKRRRDQSRAIRCPLVAMFFSTMDRLLPIRGRAPWRVQPIYQWVRADALRPSWLRWLSRRGDEGKGCGWTFTGPRSCDRHDNLADKRARRLLPIALDGLIERHDGV